MPTDVTYQIEQQTYRLDERKGRLVNLDRPGDTILLQNLETHLCSLGLKHGRTVQQQCIDVANRIDQALRRPIGSTSNSLLIAFNADHPSPPDQPPMQRRRSRGR